MIKSFRILGWLEGFSFLSLLLIAMPMKYLLGQPEGVKALGPVHGFLFIGYVLMANYVAEDLEWPWKLRVYAFLAAVLPLGTFVFERKFLAREAS